jgi:aspartate/methionine/tyrosine aminotransferase
LQFGAARALDEGEAWLLESRQAYREAGGLAAKAVRAQQPSGGTFLFFDVSAHLPANANDCSRFLEACADVGVLLTPGAACGAAYAKWVRLCYTALPPRELRLALARLQEVPPEAEPVAASPRPPDAQAPQVLPRGDVLRFRW